MSSSTQQPDRLRHALLSQVASQLVRLLVALGIGAWLARYLGPMALGQLSYVTALVGVLAPIGALGVKNSLATLLCDSTPLPGLVSTAFCLELAGTTLLALCLLPWAWFAKDSVIGGLIVLAVMANLFNSAEVFEAALLNDQRGTVVGRAGFLKVFVGALVTLVALIGRAPLLAFGAIQLLQNAFGALFLMRQVRAPSVLAMLSQVNLTAAKALLRRGFPLLVASLSIMVYMKSDQVMLQWLLGSVDVAQYSIAVRLAESIYFVPVILSETFLPRLSEDAIGPGHVAKLQNFYRIAWMLSVAMSVVTVFLLPSLVPIVFGLQYGPAQSVLAWLGPSAWVASASCASGAWLSATGRIGLYAQRSAFGAVVNVLLNIFLIPSCGVRGAAIATSVAQMASVFVFPLLIQSTRANTRLLLNPW